MSKMLDNFEGMAYVRDNYPQARLTDSQFAVKMTQDLGRDYSVAKVRAYRRELSIPNTVETISSVKQDLATAKKIISDLVVLLPLGHDSKAAELAAAFLEG
jgi:hypothetical protein